MITLFFSVIVLLSMFQLFQYLLETPKGFHFFFVHNSPSDYYYYLTFIRQGMEGKFLAVSRYTSEHIQGQPLFLFFTCIGFFGGVVGLEPAMIYTLFRFGCSVLFLLSIYFFIFRLFPQKHRVPALFLLFCITPFWYYRGNTFEQVGDFWSGIDPLMRIAFLPHHMSANGFFIVSLLFLDRAILRRSVRWGIASGIAALCCGVSNPATALLLCATVGVGLLFHLRLMNDKKSITVFCSFFLLSFFPMLLLFRSVSSAFPWNQIAAWEQTQQYPLGIIQFFLMLGPLSFVAVGGIVVAVRKSFLWKMTVGWFMAPFLLLAFQHILPLSNIRYVQAAPYVPTALIATLGGMYVVQRIPFANKHIIGMLMLGIVGMYAIPSYVISFQHQVLWVSQNRTTPLIYISFDSVDILKNLANVGASDDVVLAPDPLPLFIPALTNKRVVYAHPLYTLQFFEKQKEGYQFFGDMDGEHKAFLHRERVRFIIMELASIPSADVLDAVGCREVYRNAAYLLCERGDTY